MSRFAVASVKYFCLHPPFPTRLITQIINRANLDFKKVETYLNKFAALPLLIMMAVSYKNPNLSPFLQFMSFYTALLS